MLKLRNCFRVYLWPSEWCRKLAWDQPVKPTSLFSRFFSGLFIFRMIIGPDSLVRVFNTFIPIRVNPRLLQSEALGLSKKEAKFKSIFDWIFSDSLAPSAGCAMAA